jgi:hypothetical protein
MTARFLSRLVVIDTDGLRWLDALDDETAQDALELLEAVE